MNKETMVENTIPESVIEDIRQAIASKEYGSVEIYIESGRVVQITERTIKKTASRSFDGRSDNLVGRHR